METENKLKPYCYNCCQDMRKTYRNVGFFVYKNMKGCVAYVGVKRRILPVNQKNRVNDATFFRKSRGAVVKGLK